jgi:hypothetical protein
MLKLHAGISRKVGLPGYSSASASCHIEAELDSSLLNDTDGFRIVVQRAYQSCEAAVQDQITRLTNSEDADHDPQQAQHEVTEVRTNPTYRGMMITTSSDQQPSPRPATAAQAKAIRAICARRRIDLVSLLRERYGLTTADDLGIRQASNLIDELKSDEIGTPESTQRSRSTFATSTVPA